MSKNNKNVRLYELICHKCNRVIYREKYRVKNTCLFCQVKHNLNEDKVNKKFEMPKSKKKPSKRKKRTLPLKVKPKPISPKKIKAEKSIKDIFSDMKKREMEKLGK